MNVTGATTRMILKSICMVRAVSQGETQLGMLKKGQVVQKFVSNQLVKLCLKV